MELSRRKTLISIMVTGLSKWPDQYPRCILLLLRGVYLFALIFGVASGGDSSGSYFTGFAALILLAATGTIAVMFLPGKDLGKRVSLKTENLANKI